MRCVYVIVIFMHSFVIKYKPILKQAALFWQFVMYRRKLIMYTEDFINYNRIIILCLWYIYIVSGIFYFPPFSREKDMTSNHFIRLR